MNREDYDSEALKYAHDLRTHMADLDAPLRTPPWNRIHAAAQALRDFDIGIKDREETAWTLEDLIDFEPEGPDEEALQAAQEIAEEARATLLEDD